MLLSDRDLVDMRPSGRALIAAEVDGCHTATLVDCEGSEDVVASWHDCEWSVDAGCVFAKHDVGAALSIATDVEDGAGWGNRREILNLAGRLRHLRAGRRGDLVQKHVCAAGSGVV